MKNLLILLVIALVISGTIGGAFIGGIAVGKGQKNGLVVADISAPTGPTDNPTETEGNNSQELSPEQIAEFRDRLRTGQITQEEVTRFREQITRQRGLALTGLSSNDDQRTRITGTVKSVEGKEITISTQQGDLIAIVADDTIIRYINLVPVTDVAQGLSVVLTGSRNEEGLLETVSMTVAPQGIELGVGGSTARGGRGFMGGSGNP